MAKGNKTYKIEVEVGLDKDGVPESINWAADDNPAGGGPAPAKAMLLSLFDKDQKETYKIDLWTKEMQVVEMDRFMFQTLRALADTYHRSTNNNELASQMQQFVQFFGQQVEIIPKGE
ncbi:MAG: gliding motility protein GldC [Bacteroidota bacterium]